MVLFTSTHLGSTGKMGKTLRATPWPWEGTSFNKKTLLPLNVKLEWGNVWDRLRNRKEGAFIWALWHKVVVFNSWRARFTAEVDQMPYVQ